jgi:hypothetical protein
MRILEIDFFLIGRRLGTGLYCGKYYPFQHLQNGLNLIRR